MVHNNGRPVTFPHLRMRNTETCCIFVGLSIIGAHLPLGLGKKWKWKKNICKLYSERDEPAAVRIPGLGCKLFKSKV